MYCKENNLLNMKKAFLIHYDGYYDIRLKYVEQNLEERGYQVILLFSDFNHFTKSRKMYANKNLKLIHVPKYKKNISVKRILSYLSFTKQVRKILDEEKPDFIYAIIPPNFLANNLANFKKKHPKIKVMFDVFDLYPEQMPRLSDTPVAKIWGNLRNKSLKKVDYIILECNYYKKVLLQYLDEDKNSVLYLNRSHLEIPYEFEWKNDQIDIAYLGSINHHIDIEKIIELLSAINEKKKILFHIIGDGERRKKLIIQLKKNNIDYRFYGRIFDESKKRNILQKCQYGINIYREDLGIGLTMKSIEYYQIGLPIINSGIYDTRILCDENKSGINFEGKESVDKLVAINKEDWEILLLKSLNIFKEKFSDDSYISGLSKILDKVL